MANGAAVVSMINNEIGRKNENLAFVGYAIYLIIPFSLVLVLNGLAARKFLRRTNLVMGVTGAIPILFLVLGVVLFGAAVFSRLAFGGWLTIVAGAILLIGSFMNVKTG